MNSFKALVKGLLRRKSIDRTYDNREKDSTYYDALFAGSDEARKPFWQSRYYSTWTVVVDRVRHSPDHANILEIGCGSGQFAEFLVRECTTSYTGIDLSAEGINQAKAKQLPNCRFEAANALDTEIIRHGAYSLAICMEVLEHIHDDLKLVESLRSKTRCLFTVPNFDYESHVRFFTTCREVQDRYGQLFESIDVWAIDASHGAGLKYFLLDGVRK